MRLIGACRPRRWVAGQASNRRRRGRRGAGSYAGPYSGWAQDNVKGETRTVKSLLTEARHIVPSVCRFLVPGIGSQEEFASWQLAWVRPAARESPRMGRWGSSRR